MTDPNSEVDSVREVLHRTSFDDPRVLPADVKVRMADQVLRVQWRDGHVSEWRFDFLRTRCPCATCLAERQQGGGDRPLLPILKADPAKAGRVVHAEMVGRYALQFEWADGHKTGIYDFRYLRSLDPT